MADAAAVGVDVGGTKLAAGVVNGRGTVLARARRDTPAREAERIAPLVVELARDLAAEAGADSLLPIGVGAAGVVDRDGVMRFAPNIDWPPRYPLRAALSEHAGVPVVVDNDANVAAWGEYRAGAGRDAVGDMVLLTIGTGVGGGLIIDGRLVRGAQGLGAEFGHLIVAEGGPRCPCGNRGCLEAVASGTAIGRMAREEQVARQVPEASPLASLEPAALTGKAVTIAAQGGDGFATSLLERAGFWLGVGIATLVNALDPEAVVVGGGAMEAGELLLGPARAAMAERVIGRGHRTLPPVQRAALADDAGLVGAALLALDTAHP